MFRHMLLVVGLLIFSYLYPSNDFNLEKFLNSSPAELRKRKEELVTLEKQKNLKITPSEAQLFYPDPVKNQEKLYEQLRIIVGKDSLKKSLEDTQAGWNQGKAQDVFKPEQLIALNNAMAKEKQVYDAGGLTVYHSTQPEYYAHAYVRTKVAELLSELYGTPVAPSNMLLLRDPEVYGLELQKAKKRRKELLLGIVPDFATSDHVISANIGIAGNTAEPLPGEGLLSSTMKYWLQKFNWMHNKSLKLELGKNTPDNVRKELDDAINQYAQKNQTGTLLQLVFKSKRLAKKVMYVSGALGLKRDFKKNDIVKTVRALSERPIKLEKKLKEEIDSVRSYFQEIDSVRSYDKEVFKEVERLESLQARVIFTSDMLLDPTNAKVRKNFEVVPYTDNPQALDEFHKKVDIAIDKVRRNYIAEYRAMTLPQKFWHRLNRMLNKQQGYWQKKQIKKESEHWFIAQ